MYDAFSARMKAGFAGSLDGLTGPASEQPNQAMAHQDKTLLGSPHPTIPAQSCKSSQIDTHRPEGDAAAVGTATAGPVFVLPVRRRVGHPAPAHLARDGTLVAATFAAWGHDAEVAAGQAHPMAAFEQVACALAVDHATQLVALGDLGCLSPPGFACGDQPFVGHAAVARYKRCTSRTTVSKSTSHGRPTPMRTRKASSFSARFLPYAARSNTSSSS